MTAGWSRLRQPLSVFFLIAMAMARSCVAADAEACLGVQPNFPPVNAAPIAQSTRVDSNAAGLAGVSCFEGPVKGATWVTVAAVVQTSFGQSALIERFGAISKLPGIQYWSTTDQRWRPMISAAFAVDSSEGVKPRGDFAAAEFVPGVYRFYRITDTRSKHAIAYELRLRVGPPGHVIVETANSEPLTDWGVTLYPADGVHTLYFLRERSPGTWSFYSITRAVPATFLAEGHEKSFINRAVALFRHYMQLPGITDTPPAR
jgi:hypothetical protein